MEPVFCDLCQHSVPVMELAAGRARQRGERVVCESCLALLTTRAGREAGGEGTPAALAGPTGQIRERNRRRAALVLATVLAGSALAFSVAATALLLLRLERQADEARGERERLADELAQQRLRFHGLERFVTRRVREEVEGLRSDLRRGIAPPDERLRELALAEFESTREELARELALALERDSELPPAERAADEPSTVPLLGLSDLEERLTWLEDQLSDLRLRRDLPAERAPIETGLPRPPYPGADDPARAGVVARLASEDPALRAGALFALAAAGDRAAVRDVLPLLGDPHPYVRETTARLLERLEARTAVQPLIAALEDRDVHVREAAVTALRGITGRSFGFDPRADSGSRAAAVAAWRAWWRDAWKTFLYGEGATAEGG